MASKVSPLIIMAAMSYQGFITLALGLLLLIPLKFLVPNQQLKLHTHFLHSSAIYFM
jgi:UPF0716 family protein affecting phage T7 exclusion